MREKHTGRPQNFRMLSEKGRDTALPSVRSWFTPRAYGSSMSRRPSPQHSRSRPCLREAPRAELSRIGAEQTGPIESPRAIFRLVAEQIGPQSQRSVFLLTSRIPRSGVISRSVRNDDYNSRYPDQIGSGSPDISHHFTASLSAWVRWASARAFSSSSLAFLRSACLRLVLS
jgi:hypothetical protein